MNEKARLFEERLNRYTIAMDCGKPDRVPIALSIGDWVVKYTDNTFQQVFYDLNLNNKIVDELLPELDIDIFGGGPTLWWPPMFDALGSKLYKFPGMGLEETLLSMLKKNI